MNPTLIALNQAILNYVLHEIYQGNYNACRAIGFSDDVLCRLQELTPTKLSRLVYCRVPWGRYEIDPDVFTRLVDSLDESNDPIISRAIQLGASSSMMLEYFGLTHCETAQRRRLLRVPSRKGRFPVLTEKQKLSIWAHWKSLIKNNGKPLSQLSALEKLDFLMQISEEQCIALANVWQEVLTYTGAESIS